MSGRRGFNECEAGLQRMGGGASMNGRRGFNECEARLHTAALYFKGGVARAKGRGYAKWAGSTSNIPPSLPAVSSCPG